MKTDNELIAEFMGLKTRKISLLSDNDITVYYKKSAKDWFNLPDYGKSWDSIMPVLETIEKHGAIVELNICLATMCRIVAVNGSRENVENFINGGSITLLDAAYMSVVEFIKWYNKKSLSN
jgi:hypothetical protein